MAARLEVEGVCAPHRGVALPEDVSLPRGDLQLEEAGHRLDDSLLQREGLEGVILGRQAAQDARARPVHEARVEAQPVPEARETRRYHQRRAERAPRRVGRGHARLAHVARGHHGQAGVVGLELREAGGQGLDEAVGAEAVLGVGAREVDGQDGHALLGRKRGPSIHPSADRVAREGEDDQAEAQRSRHCEAVPGPQAQPPARGHRGGRDGRGARAAHLREVLAHAAKLAGEVECRRVALGRVLGQAPLDDPPRGGREGGVLEGRRLVLDDRGEGLDRRLPLEGRVAAHHLVEHRAEGELVGAVVHGPAARLLGRHVPDGAHHDTGGGVGRARRAGPGRHLREALAGRPIRAAPVAAQLGEAEVEDLHVAVARQHHVLGLEVAVDDAGGVGAGEPVGQLAGDVEHPAGRERELGADEAAQRPPSTSSMTVKGSPAVSPIS